MKKIVSYIFSTFVFIFLSLCVSVKVDAAISDFEIADGGGSGSGTGGSGSETVVNNSFWKLVEGFTVVDNDVAGQYEFYPDYHNDELKDGAKVYNYNFYYDYTIRTVKPLKDGNNQVFAFYGSFNSIEVVHDNLTGLFIGDEFKIYKYNFTSQEFESLYTPGKDKKGSYTLSLGDTCGVYKLMVTGLDGGTKETYVVVDDNIVNASIDEIEINQEETSVTIISTLVAPFDPLNVDHAVSLSVGNLTVSSMIDSSDITLENSSSGAYKLVVKYIPTGDVAVANSATIKLVINDFAIIKSNVTYDFVRPTMNRGKFYNSNLIRAEFGYEPSTESMVPSSWAYKFKVTDVGTGVANVETDVDGIICTYEDEYATCIGDSSIVESGSVTIKFIVTDAAGNSNSRNETIEFDTDYMDSVTLESLVSIENGVISLADGTDIDTLCIFYGGTLDELYECQKGTSITSTYYYSGPVTIVVLDEHKNITSVAKKVEFKNGYDANQMSTSVAAITSLNLSQAYDYLNTYVKGENNVKKYVKYGELIEEYDSSETIRLTYVDVLNDKVQDSTCAFNTCDITVDVYMVFDIAGVEQKISRYYTMKDELPSISNNISTAAISLEYKNFDITNISLKTKLYADGLFINLVDDNDHEYTGEITSSFVSYIDKNGVVTKLDDEPYDYIASVSALGTYLLECKVQILKNTTMNVDYSDRYGKSFFIRVNLEDNTLPTIMLLGEENVTLKQYDVYKDSGAACEDDTTCVLTINYYLNGLDNKVNSIDTSVAGTYTIEYVATDEGGNVAKTTRTVVVENINSLDTNSIIIIVSVVVLFIIFVTTGIIVEKKKSRPASREE